MITVRESRKRHCLLRSAIPIAIYVSVFMLILIYVRGLTSNGTSIVEILSIFRKTILAETILIMVAAAISFSIRLYELREKPLTEALLILTIVINSSIGLTPFTTPRTVALVFVVTGSMLFVSALLLYDALYQRCLRHEK